MTAIPQPSTHPFNRRDLIPPYTNLLWKIEHGAVRTLTWDHNGEIIALGIWGPGDVIGRPLSSLDPYQMQCLTAVEARMLRDSLWKQMLTAILLHTQQGEELFKIVRCQPTDQRLLQFLVWLGQKFGYPSEQGQRVGLCLTHQEIAETLSTSRVTVTRLLNRFEQQGMIQRNGRHWMLLASFINQGLQYSQ